MGSEHLKFPRVEAIQTIKHGWISVILREGRIYSSEPHEGYDIIIKLGKYYLRMENYIWPDNVEETYEKSGFKLPDAGIFNIEKTDEILKLHGNINPDLEEMWLHSESSHITDPKEANRIFDGVVEKIKDGKYEIIPASYAVKLY